MSGENIDIVSQQQQQKTSRSGSKLGMDSDLIRNNRKLKLNENLKEIFLRQTENDSKVRGEGAKVQEGEGK